jgi:hypothetical protein
MIELHISQLMDAVQHYVRNWRERVLIRFKKVENV